MGDAKQEADLIDIRLLRTFMVVAQELSFTRAGARLFLSQQAVSSQVRSLEASLGMQLFLRTTRNVGLTPSGQLLLERMQPVLQAMDEAINDAREAGVDKGAILLIGHTASVEHRLLPRAVGLLERTAPELRLRSEQHTEVGLRNAVAEGRVHLGVGLELGFRASRITSRAVARESWCAVVGAQHPLAGRERLVVADLAGYEWLSWPRSSHPGHWRAVQRLAATTAPPTEVRETWLSIAHSRLTSGEAVMLQPSSYMAQPAQGLVPLPLDDAPPCHYSAIWSTLATPPGLQQLLAALTRAADIPLPAATALGGGGVPARSPK
ncbi:HTH-type transcriptional regulator BenM [Streptomyces sp. ADI96-02]|uniref:LysR family transcriptional regulator n=1 Tax=unclassified Streptomyces TaxID=2593676 RepID=UPI000F54FD8E|nr:LysR family transcriptional regulator [Streptomyces sp. ADI96-02]RPK54869.1 HTH-type transcriptional regulator BenM [Streptomyces sp. ADI96-02]